MSPKSTMPFLFQDFIEQCCIQIDSMLREATTACFGEESSSNQEPMTSDQLRPDEFTPPPKSGKLEELETAVTPTDVRDVRFWGGQFEKSKTCILNSNVYRSEEEKNVYLNRDGGRQGITLYSFSTSGLSESKSTIVILVVHTLRKFCSYIRRTVPALNYMFLDWDCSTSVAFYRFDSFVNQYLPSCFALRTKFRFPALVT